MKSKSSVGRIVCILVTVALYFFQEEGFVGETFLFFKGSTSSLGHVTSPFFFSASTSSSTPWSGDSEAVFPEALLKSWTSIVFFLLFVPGVSCSL
jgi:hypothetical protein